LTYPFLNLLVVVKGFDFLADSRNPIFLKNRISLKICQNQNLTTGIVFKQGYVKTKT